MSRGDESISNGTPTDLLTIPHTDVEAYHFMEELSNSRVPHPYRCLVHYLAKIRSTAVILGAECQHCEDFCEKFYSLRRHLTPPSGATHGLKCYNAGRLLCYKLPVA